MSRRRIVYWLVPAHPERELFRAIIAILAQQLQSPRFEPHLTLCSTSNDSRSPSVLGKVTGEPLRLTLTGIRWSSKYTKTLFARFRPSAQLNEFAGSLQVAAGQRKATIRDPHLSLCYKRLTPTMKKKLAQLIRLPLRDVLFDTVCAVRCSVPTRSAADVEAWKIIARRRLKSAGSRARRPAFTVR